MILENYTLLQKLTYFSFVFTFFGMAAASLFFAFSAQSLHPRWRTSALVSAAITMVAAMTYFNMKDIYLAGLASKEQIFPTEFRYIDWFITVPLMLIKFPMLLGLGKKGITFMRNLVIFSILMLIGSFIGEINIGNPIIHYPFYILGCVFWVIIIVKMNSAIKQLPPSAPDSVVNAVRRIFNFILLGWLIYPIGFLIPDIGLAADWRELIYNIGDLINKVGLGLVIIGGSFANRREDAIKVTQEG